MNKITKIGFTLPLLLVFLLTVTISACKEVKTTVDAPNSTNTNGQVVTEKQSDKTQNDAQSETRRKQLNADIQAREQRNQMGGDTQKRAEGDLALTDGHFFFDTIAAYLLNRRGSYVKASNS